MHLNLDTDQARALRVASELLAKHLKAEKKKAKALGVSGTAFDHQLDLVEGYETTPGLIHVLSDWNPLEPDEDGQEELFEEGPWKLEESAIGHFRVIHDVTDQVEIYLVRKMAAARAVELNREWQQRQAEKAAKAEAAPSLETWPAPEEQVAEEAPAASEEPAAIDAAAGPEPWPHGEEYCPCCGQVGGVCPNCGTPHSPAMPGRTCEACSPEAGAEVPETSAAEEDQTSTPAPPPVTGSIRVETTFLQECWGWDHPGDDAVLDAAAELLADDAMTWEGYKGICFKYGKSALRKEWARLEELRAEAAPGQLHAAAEPEEPEAAADVAFTEAVPGEAQAEKPAMASPASPGESVEASDERESALPEGFADQFGTTKKDRQFLEAYERNPALLEVTCPRGYCQAQPGQPCRSAAGNICPPHVPRADAAKEQAAAGELAAEDRQEAEEEAEEEAAAVRSKLEGMVDEFMQPIAACISCGCTDDRACEGGCSWVWVDRETQQGRCSSCASVSLDDINPVVVEALCQVGRESELLLDCTYNPDGRSLYRWAKRAEQGLTDTALRVAIVEEFGQLSPDEIGGEGAGFAELTTSAGTITFGNRPEIAGGGPYPLVWFNSADRMNDAAVRGDELLDRIRQLYHIPRVVVAAPAPSAEEPKQEEAPAPTGPYYVEEIENGAFYQIRAKDGVRATHTSRASAEQRRDELNAGVAEVDLPPSEPAAEPQPEESEEDRQIGLIVRDALCQLPGSEEFWAAVAAEGRTNWGLEQLISERFGGTDGYKGQIRVGSYRTRGNVDPSISMSIQASRKVIHLRGPNLLDAVRRLFGVGLPAEIHA
jgi:hypothetical protein